MAINLQKLEERKKIVVNLVKRSNLDNSQKSQVVLCMDRSGSMDHLYKDNTVQSVIERILPIGLTFDDNGEVDVYFFHDKAIEAVGVTVNNLDGYIKTLMIKASKLEDL